MKLTTQQLSILKAIEAISNFVHYSKVPWELVRSYLIGNGILSKYQLPYTTLNPLGNHGYIQVVYKPIFDTYRSIYKSDRKM